MLSRSLAVPRREAKVCFIRPYSTVNIPFLTMITKQEFEITADHQAENIVVNLTGRLNLCGVINPRFSVQLKDLEKWQNNLLPSYQFGFMS